MEGEKDKREIAIAECMLATIIFAVMCAVCIYQIWDDFRLYYYGEKRTVEVRLVTKETKEYRVKSPKKDDPKYITEYRYYWKEGLRNVEIVPKLSNEERKRSVKRMAYGEKVRVIYVEGSEDCVLEDEFDFGEELMGKHLWKLVFFGAIMVIMVCALRHGIKSPNDEKT